MELYGYFRSSAAFRVRIALNLKQLEHKHKAVNLLEGEHKSGSYRALNPQGLVPILKTDGGDLLSQSVAILEWLEECYPEIPLLPKDPVARARVRSLCAQIGCDIHPICNLRVLNYVADTLGAGKEGKIAWVQHWINEGFTALEAQLGGGPYCAGNKVTLADVYLIPQLYNALRFELDMSAFPKIMAVNEACHQLPAFVNARPENQPDSTIQGA